LIKLNNLISRKIEGYLNLLLVAIAIAIAIAIALSAKAA